MYLCMHTLACTYMCVVYAYMHVVYVAFQGDWEAEMCLCVLFCCCCFVASMAQQQVADVLEVEVAAPASGADESTKVDKDGFCYWVRSLPKPKPTGSVKGDAHASARRVNFMKLCQHLCNNPQELYFSRHKDRQTDRQTDRKTDI